nr:hypothetical protein [Nonomuraea lactucae]
MIDLVKLDPVDLFDARQQVHVQQPGDSEARLRLPVRVHVIALDLHGGAMQVEALSV